MTQIYNLKIKQTTGASLEFEIDSDEMTVFDLKQLKEIEWPEVDSHIEKLIFRGKILKNNMLLCNVKSKNVLSLKKTLLCESKEKKKNPFQVRFSADKRKFVFFFTLVQLKDFQKKLFLFLCLLKCRRQAQKILTIKEDSFGTFSI